METKVMYFRHIIDSVRFGITSIPDYITKDYIDNYYREGQGCEPLREIVEMQVMILGNF
jgi:hypothetical protein